jgi:hypothetical protein
MKPNTEVNAPHEAAGFWRQHTTVALNAQLETVPHTEKEAPTILTPNAEWPRKYRKPANH